MAIIREVHAQSESWQVFCAEQAAPTLFQSPQWSAALERTYGFFMGGLIALEGDRVVAGMPYAQINDFRGGRRVTLPFSDNVEALPEQSWGIFEAYIAASGIPWSVRTRNVPTSLAGSQREAAQHHLIELPETFEAAASSFHLKHRQNYQQAQRAGLTVERGGVELLPTFYALHTQVRRSKHGLLPQGLTFFTNICDVFFPEHGFILVAKDREQPVSAMFFLRYRDVLYYKFSASALDALRVRPNHFLITKAIEIAIEERMKALDLGISDAEGLIRFKQRIGGRASTVHAATYNAHDKSDAVKSLEQTLGDLTKLLTSEGLPDETVQKGGEILYRFFT